MKIIRNVSNQKPDLSHYHESHLQEQIPDELLNFFLICTLFYSKMLSKVGSTTITLVFVNHQTADRWQTFIHQVMSWRNSIQMLLTCNGQAGESSAVHQLYNKLHSCQSTSTSFNTSLVNSSFHLRKVHCCFHVPPNVGASSNTWWGHVHCCNTTHAAEFKY